MKLLVPFLIALMPAYASAITPPGSAAEGQIKGSLPDAMAHTQSVFKKMGIKPTGSKSEDAGTKQTLEGRKGDLNVWVELEKADAKDQVEVEVTAKKEGALTWNNDFARQVMDGIIESS